MEQWLHTVMFLMETDDANAECSKSVKMVKKENLPLCKKGMHMELTSFSTSSERHEEKFKYTELILKNKQ
jgi:hypothetical protein